MTSPISAALRILSVLIADQDESIRYSLPMVASFVSLADAHPDRLTADEISRMTGLNPESVVRALGGLGEYAKQRAAYPLFMVNEHTAGEMKTFGLNDAGLAMRQQMLATAEMSGTPLGSYQAARMSPPEAQSSITSAHALATRQ